MKKVIIVLLLISTCFIYQKSIAQLHVGVNINVGTQPLWGPEGYDHVEYYYLPDIDVFYNVPNRQYVYQDRGRWITSTNLPPQYRNYDLYKGYKVVVNDYKPYNHPEVYRQKYAQYKGRHDQKVIRESQDSRYFVNKEHPQHDRWQREHGNDRGRDKDDQRDRKYSKDDNDRNKNHGDHH